MDPGFKVKEEFSSSYFCFDCLFTIRLFLRSDCFPRDSLQGPGSGASFPVLNTTGNPTRERVCADWIFIGQYSENCKNVGRTADSKYEKVCFGGDFCKGWLICQLN